MTGLSSLHTVALRLEHAIEIFFWFEVRGISQGECRWLRFAIWGMVLLLLTSLVGWWNSPSPAEIIQ